MKQHGDGFFGDAWNTTTRFVKDNHILSGIGGAVTPLLAAWNPVAGTAAAAATAALKQNGWGNRNERNERNERNGRDGRYYNSHKIGTPGVSASYGLVKFKKPARK